jgi:hypothetical protein
MGRVALAFLFAVVASARFASAAAISVAGADCGSDPLLGLTFVSATGSNLSSLVLNTSGSLCPSDNLGFGAIVNTSDSAPLYGPSITSLDLMITNPDVSITDLTSLQGSAFTEITPIGNDTFRLSGGDGIQVSCLSSVRTENFSQPVCSPVDALITFDGFAKNTTFAVTAVNPVPEPATGALVLTGLGAVFLLGRRARRRAA